MKARTQSCHPATPGNLLSSSSRSREKLLAQPQLLVELVATACAEQIGRSVLVALVEQAGSRLSHVQEFSTALQQQLEGGSPGAGELLWALTGSAAGRQLVVEQPGILTAAVAGARACCQGLQCHDAGMRPAAHAWAAGLLALASSEDVKAAAMAQAPQLVQVLQHLLLVQLEVPRTLQQDQQQEPWELLGEALTRSDLLQAWGTPGLVLAQQQQEEHQQQQQQQFQPSITGWLLHRATFLTYTGALMAAARVVQVLLSSMPLVFLENELFAVGETPALLLQLQGRLDLLGETSLLEGVAALAQRCTPKALPAAAAAERIRGELGSWDGLYKAAQRVQPEAVKLAVAAMRAAHHSMPVLLAGVRMALPHWVKRLSSMLDSRTNDSKQQLLGMPELPGAIAAALDKWNAQWAERFFLPRLLHWPELVCGNPELQDTVVACLRQYGRRVMRAMEYPPEWATVLQMYVSHPRTLAALLLDMVLPGLEGSWYCDRMYHTLAAVEGLQEAVLRPDGDVLDQLLVSAYLLHPKQQEHHTHYSLLKRRTDLLLHWPAERVLPAVARRLTSSNNQVVLGALLALQHLQEDRPQRPSVPGSNSSTNGGNSSSTSTADPAAADGALCAQQEAVAAAVRAMAQAGDMQHVISGIQEVAKHLAQQHQQLGAEGPAGVRCTQQQHQQQQPNSRSEQQLLLPPLLGAGEKRQQEPAAPPASRALGAQGATGCSMQHSKRSLWVGLQQQQQQQQQQQDAACGLEQVMGPPGKRHRTDAEAAGSGQ